MTGLLIVTYFISSLITPADEKEETTSDYKIYFKDTIMIYQGLYGYSTSQEFIILNISLARVLSLDMLND